MNSYAAARRKLLDRITRTLPSDNRFPAAWLAGSFGRDEADRVSDLDLTIVVASPYSQALCARPWMAGASTPKERLALISRFGKPAVIHENHHNAPPDGTFTFALYEGSALMVDWILVPSAAAMRPPSSRLLFDKSGIPLQDPVIPGDLQDRLPAVSERLAFFWMMAAVTLKYIIRQDTVKTLELLEMLYRTVREVEQLLAGELWAYQRGSLAPLVPTREEQAREVYQLANKMVAVTSQVKRIGGQTPRPPMDTLDVLLGMLP